MPLSKKPETYFISAGEVSGDLLAADLVVALREMVPRLSPFGVTGPAMVNAGVESIADISELGVMGVGDVLKKLPALRELEVRLLTWVDRVQPKFAILVDNPGFHLRLAEQLKMRGVRVYQYVAPKIWAWGEGRAAQIRQAFDQVLGILPFEEEFFRSRGIAYTYVGSPLKDRIDKVIVDRRALGLPQDRPVIACLPGSRMGELRRIMPILARVRAAIASRLPEAVFYLPMAPGLTAKDVATALGLGTVERTPAGGNGDRSIAVESWSVGGFTCVPGMSLELLAAADAAVVASGTATLECALLGTPLVVVYAMGELSYEIARRAVKIRDVSLVNLLAGRRLVQEYIQDVPAEEVAAEVVALITDTVRRKAMRDRFEDIRDRLKGAAAETAALTIARAVGDGDRAGAGG